MWEKDDHNCDVRALTAAIEELSSFCPEARAFNIAEIFFDQAAPGFEPQSLSPIEGDLKRARAARLTWRALQPESPLIPWAMQKSPGFAAVLSRVILPMNQLMLEHHSHQDPTPEQAPLYQVLELVERNSSILTSMPFWNGERKAHDIHLAVKKIRDRIKGLEKCTRELGLSDEERALANQELRKILNVEWPRLVFESGLWDALANRRAFLTTQFHYKYTRSAAELLSLVPVLEEYRSLWHRLEPVKPAEVSMPVCVSEIQDIAIAASALLRLMRSPLRSPLRDSPLADCIEKAMKNYAEEAERLKVKWADDPRSLREVGWDQVVLRTGLWDAMSKHSEEKSRFRLDVDEVLERLSKYSQDWELPLPEKKGVVEAVGKLRRMGLQPCFDQIFRFSKKSCSILSGSVNPLGPFSVMYRHLRKDPARFAAYEQLLADIKKLDESVAKFQIALKRTGFQRVFGTINPDARVFGTINLADMGAYDILEFAWFKLILESPLWAHFSKGGVLAEFLPDRRARLVKNLRPLLDELNVFADEWSLKRLAQYRKEALYSEPDITSGLKSERDESSEQEVLSPVN